MKDHFPVICAAILAMMLIYGLATEESRMKSKVIGLTAVCNDGSFSTSPRGRGVCSAHGGVKEWVE